MQTEVPNLRTVGRVADELGVSISRVAYVLKTRSHIEPSARAGGLRLFDREAVEQIRDELDDIEVRRNRKAQPAGGTEEDCRGRSQ